MAHESARRPVYIGTRTHAGDLTLLQGLPDQLSEALGRHVRIDVVGVTQGDLPSGFDRVSVPSQGYAEFVRWIRQQRSRWNVGLAPLADDELNESKSNLKLLDYAALELPAVASERGPYRVADDLALLVDDDLSSWTKAVASLVGDTEVAARQAAGARARTASSSMLDEAAVNEWLGLVLNDPTRS
jgi:hypothetical protein